MLIHNVNVFTEQSFHRGAVDFDAKILRVLTGEETAARPDALDGEDGFLIPGLIDIHTHGALGADASDGSEEGLGVMGRFYAAEGVTSWCPTTMTLPEATLSQAVRSIHGFRRSGDSAKIAGIHLEGPFLNAGKCGAQNPDHIVPPDADMFRRLQEEAGGLIRLITVAPESPGAVEFIREISGECTVSLGHTAADYETAMRAYDAGARHATHLFNAMTPLSHRAPGVVAAASDAGASVELICDTLHVFPPMMRLVQRLFGEKLVLISDSLRCAGMPDGDYELGGQLITMRDGHALMKGTDTIAGSSIHLMEGLRRSVSCGIPLEAAVYAASTAPARAIGMDGRIGAIAPGMQADLVLLDRDLRVKSVFIDGEKLSSAKAPQIAV